MDTAAKVTRDEASDCAEHRLDEVAGGFVDSGRGLSDFRGDVDASGGAEQMSEGLAGGEEDDGERHEDGEDHSPKRRLREAASLHPSGSGASVHDQVPES